MSGGPPAAGVVAARAEDGAFMGSVLRNLGDF